MPRWLNPKMIFDRGEENEIPIWLSPRMVDDPEVKNLSAEEFYRLFMEATNGGENVISKYVKYDPNPNLD